MLGLTRFEARRNTLLTSVFTISRRYKNGYPLVSELFLELGSMAHSISELDDLVDDTDRVVKKTDDRLGTATTQGWIGSSKRAMTMAKEHFASEGSALTAKVAHHHGAFLHAAREYARQDEENAESYVDISGGAGDDDPKLKL